MASAPLRIRRPLLTVLAIAWLATSIPVPSANAQDAGEARQAAPAPAPEKSTMVSLIERLASRGALSKDDAVELVAQANADSADARVQAAEAVLAAAKAEAALAKAQAAAAQAAFAVARAKEAIRQVGSTRGAQIAAAKQLLGLPAGAPGNSGAGADVFPDSAAPQQPAADAAVAASGDNPRAGAPVAEQAEPARPASMPADGDRSQDGASAPAPAPDTQSALVDNSPPSDVGAQAPRAMTRAHRGKEGAVSVSDVLGDGAPAAPADSGSTDTASAVPDSSNASPGEQTSASSGPTESSPAEEPSHREAASADQVAAGGDGTQATRVSDALGETAPSATPQTPSADQSAAGGDSPGQADRQGTPSDGQGAGTADASAAPQGDAPAAPVGDETPERTREVSQASGSRRHKNSGGVLSADDTVTVAYVPEVVRNQITAEVKDEVIAQARKEGWGGKTPEWVTRLTLYGDIRVRFEALINHSTNDNTGAFPNFNAINTGAPFDTTGAVYSPQFNVDQNRRRERLRARLGLTVDLENGFTAGLRLATGNDNNPVTENQTFGAAGNAQGGDFAKYAIWLDRGYIRYMSPGDQASRFSLTLGRFDNPFQSTTLIWANDLAFDGAVMKLPLKAHFGEESTDAFKPFIVAGIFPIFNTDLNFASNQPAKFPSYDKWLEAAQVGATWKLGDDFTFKSAVALYYYQNVQGQLSTPFTPLTTSDAGSTDASRPSFAQNGNTYMLLRDIVPGPLNGNGTIDQWQYYGLATRFHELALTQEIDYNHFEPFQVALVGEYVKNLAFNQALIAPVAINNKGPAVGGVTPYLGGDKGWLVNLKVGDLLLEHFGDWNAAVGYRHVESDAVVDGFNDADFGGTLTGTNLQGYTLSASLAIAKGVWFEGHWFAATSIVGPVYKNDLLQLDMNVKF